MCLAVPLRLIEITGNDRYFKRSEYRLNAGFAIERLPEQQAMEDLESWEELKDVLG